LPLLSSQRQLAALRIREALIAEKGTSKTLPFAFETPVRPR